VLEIPQYKYPTLRLLMIYWDANASSRLRPVASRAISSLVSEGRALNPSSVHSEGRYARALLRKARENILSYLGLSLSDANADLFFVSGGTEACNSLVYGFCPISDALANTTKPHLVSSAIEHVAMLEPLRKLEEAGCELSLINANRLGLVPVEDFLGVVRRDTSVVSLMLANNETGKVQEVATLARLLRQGGYQGVIISDATQAVGKSSVVYSDLFDAGVDALAISSHKMGGVGGIGAIILNTKMTCRLFEPLIRGGGQEGRMRGGTEFVLGAYAWGEIAAYLSDKGHEERKVRLYCRNLLLSILKDQISGIHSYSPEVTQEGNEGLDNTLLLRFEGCRADDLTVALDLDGVCVSMGAACSSGKQDVSHVLLSMGLTKEEARECVRISLDWDVTEESVRNGAIGVVRSVHRMRSCV